MTTATAPQTATGRDRQQFRTIRLAEFVDLEFRVDGSKREFDGIAVPWEREIDVDGWAYESWQSGAFNHQVRAASRVKVGRGHIPLGGTLIGRLKAMSNDAKGLRISGKVTPGISAGDDTLALMEDKALDELSIGFYDVPGGTIMTRDTDSRPHYRMVKADLFEVAIVEWGAYGRTATVDALRQRDPRARERIEVATGFRTVAIHVDGVEVASYRLPAAGEPVQPAEPAPPVEPVDEPIPASVADVDAMLAALPTFA